MGPGDVLDIIDKAEMVLTGPQKLEQVWLRHRAKVMQEWWDELTMRFNEENRSETEEKIRTKLFDVSDRDFAIKTISQSTRSLLDSVDETVRVPLAILTAEYISQQKPPDGFFRGVCRSLSDMALAHLAILRKVALSVEQAVDSRESMPGYSGQLTATLRIKQIMGEAQRPLYRHFLEWRPRNISQDVDVPMEPDEYQAYEETLAILRRYGVISTVIDAGVSAPIPVTVLRRIAKLVRSLDYLR